MTDPLRIALDYDDTFSADPDLWLAFIDMARQRGHEVVCVTGRGGHRPVTGFPGQVIYTNGAMKAPMAFEAGHQSFDIWIDDMPHLIGRPV